MKQLQRDGFDAFWGIWSDRSTMWKGLVQISWIPQFRKNYVYRQHDDEPLDFVLPYFSDNPSGML